MITRTYSYKRIGSHEIRADVYCPDARSRAPVVLWLHGGGHAFDVLQRDDPTVVAAMDRAAVFLRDHLDHERQG